MSRQSSHLRSAIGARYGDGRRASSRSWSPTRHGNGQSYVGKTLSSLARLRVGGWSDRISPGGRWGALPGNPPFRERQSDVSEARRQEVSLNFRTLSAEYVSHILRTALERPSPYGEGSGTLGRGVKTGPIFFAIAHAYHAIRTKIATARMAPIVAPRSRYVTPSIPGDASLFAIGCDSGVTVARRRRRNGDRLHAITLDVDDGRLRDLVAVGDAGG